MPTIVDVQSTSGNAATTTLPTFLTDPHDGDTIVVAYGLYDFTGTVLTPFTDLPPTDPYGNTYVRTGTTQVLGNAGLSLWRAENIVGGGSFQITVHPNATYFAAVAWVLTDVDPASYNGDWVTAQLNSAPITVGPTSPAPPAGSLFLGFAVVAFADVLTDAAGWNATGVNGFTSTLRGRANLANYATYYDIFSQYLISSSAETPTWTGNTPAKNWVAMALSFQGPAGPDPTESWILLNDVSAAARIRRENTAIAIHDQLNNAPNTARLTVQGQPGGPGPQGGSSLEILDPATGERIYKGSLQRVEQFYDGLPSQLGWHVDAVDATWRLNKYRPFGSFVDVSATDVVLALLAFAPGFTGDHVQTTLAPITITFDGTQTISEACSAICQAIGAGHWYVDYDDDLHLFRSVVPAFDPLLPPAPLTGVTVSNGTNPLGLTPAYIVVLCAYQYADGTVSTYGPLSNVWANDDGKTLQIDDIPIGDPDVDHGAVVARLFSYQVLSNPYDGVNPSPPWRLFTLGDNSTTSVEYGFVAQTTPPVTVVHHSGVRFGFPAAVDALPDGPTPALTVTVDTADTTAAEGWPTGVIDLTYAFAMTGVYDHGIESLLGPWSDEVTDQPVGGLLKQFLFADVPIVADVDGHACVYRKIYARFSYEYPPGGPNATVVDAIRGWLIVPDNTATDFTDLGRALNVTARGFCPTPLPMPLRVDGPDPETDAAPDPIDADTTTLLDDPPITLSEDFSQIRTRVFGRGRGSTVLDLAPSGQTYVSVVDPNRFDPSGGQAIADGTVLQYTGVSGSALLLTAALAADLAIGTPVQVWVQRDDVAAQADLGAIELDADGLPTDGVHEYFVPVADLPTLALIARLDSELAVFSRPIRTVTYATRDPKSTSGKQVAIDLVDPPIVGTFVIQDVTIDQIQIQESLVARYSVTASSVRFTLDDFLQRVVLGAL